MDSEKSEGTGENTGSRKFADCGGKLDEQGDCKVGSPYVLTKNYSMYVFMNSFLLLPKLQGVSFFLI